MDAVRAGVFEERKRTIMRRRLHPAPRAGSAAIQRQHKDAQVGPSAPCHGDGVAHIGGMTDQPGTPAARLRVVDLETTGDSFSNGGVVEVGWQDLTPDADGAWTLRGGPGSKLVNPDCPISAVTSAIHHIVDEDVVGAPAWDAAAPDVLQGEGVRALAAHRAAFEQRWCPPRLTGHARWICTWKCALRLWPAAPTHSNQGLRYWRRPAGLDRAAGLPAHRAGPDAYVTAHHLRDMLALASVEQMLAWSEQPALLVRVPHGSLRGRRWEALDDDQLDQVLGGQYGHNQDMLFTARAERARRCEGTASPEQMRLHL